jgi:hypothetical protein
VGDMGVLTLEQVRKGASPALYPRHALVGCADALVLFAAAFHGQQDAVWMAEAGLRTTCVDIDQEKLREMMDAYPDSWSFVQADVFEFSIRTERRWDVVSIDCPSNLFERCADLMPLWCRIAKRVVVLGCDKRTACLAPEGWSRVGRLHRSHNYGGVYWMVFERDS